MSPGSFDLYRYDLLLSEPVKLKGTTLHRRRGVLIRLTGDEGPVGWGEAAPLPGFSAENLDDVVDQLRGLAPPLRGRKIPPDPAVPATFLPPDLRAPEMYASVRFGLELALWNCMAVSPERQPSQLLTGRTREEIPVNGLLSGAIETVLAEAKSMREGGYGVVKLKVGGGAVAEDVETVRKVKEVLGEGVSLRLDANRAWAFEEALEFGRGVSGVAVGYVEEPLAEPWRLPELAEIWGLPVALDESLVAMEPEDLGEHPYARAVVLKPTLLGGILRTLGFAKEAKALGMVPVISSSYESGVGTGALVALAAAIDGEPAGLDTYRRLAGDVLEGPLPVPAPTVDVRRTMEAARRVEVGRLEHIPTS